MYCQGFGETDTQIFTTATNWFTGKKRDLLCNHKLLYVLHFSSFVYIIPKNWIKSVYLILNRDTWNNILNKFSPTSAFPIRLWWPMNSGLSLQMTLLSAEWDTTYNSVPAPGLHLVKQVYTYCPSLIF